MTIIMLVIFLISPVIVPVSVYKIFWKKKKLWAIVLFLYTILYITSCYCESWIILPYGSFNENAFANTFATFLIVTSLVICYPVILLFAGLIFYGIYAGIKKKSANFWKKYSITMLITTIVLYLTFPFAISIFPKKDLISNNIVAARMTPINLFKARFYGIAFSATYPYVRYPAPQWINEKMVSECIESGEFACNYYSPDMCDSLAGIYLVTKNYDKLEHLSDNISFKGIKLHIERMRGLGYLIEGKYQKALEIQYKEILDIKTSAYKGLKQYDKALELWNDFLLSEKPSKSYYYCDAFKEKAGIYYEMGNKQQELKEFENFKTCIKSFEKNNISYDQFKKLYDHSLNLEKENQKIIEDALK